MRRRTGPGREHRPSRQPELGGSGPRLLRAQAGLRPWRRRLWRASWPSSWTCWSSRGTRRSRSAGTAAGPGLGFGPAVPLGPPTLSAQTSGGPPSWGLGLTSLGVGICPPDSSSPDRGCEGARPPTEMEASSPPRDSPFRLGDP